MAGRAKTKRTKRKPTKAQLAKEEQKFMRENAASSSSDSNYTVDKAADMEAKQARDEQPNTSGTALTQTGRLSFQIDDASDFPIPPNARRRAYPFGDMDVGDSFLVEGDDTDFARARNAASAYKRVHGYSFMSRRVADNAIRIWRIE